MYSTSIILLAVGLLATVAMARPGRRPWPGHHHGNSENEVSQGQNEGEWSTYRLPNQLRLPRLLAEKLGRPLPTYSAKKIFNGKYLLISPALIFKLKGETDASTTSAPGSSTARPTRTTAGQPDVDETTTANLDETTTATLDETTTVDLDENSTTAELDEASTTIAGPEDETTTPTPSFFRKRSVAIDENEQLLFLED